MLGEPITMLISWSGCFLLLLFHLGQLAHVQSRGSKTRVPSTTDLARSQHKSSPAGQVADQTKDDKMSHWSIAIQGGNGGSRSSSSDAEHVSSSSSEEHEHISSSSSKEHEHINSLSYEEHEHISSLSSEEHEHVSSSSSEEHEHISSSSADEDERDRTRNFSSEGRDYIRTRTLSSGEDKHDRTENFSSEERDYIGTYTLSSAEEDERDGTDDSLFEEKTHNSSSERGKHVGTNTLSTGRHGVRTNGSFSSEEFGDVRKNNSGPEQFDTISADSSSNGSASRALPPTSISKHRLTSIFSATKTFVKAAAAEDKSATAETSRRLKTVGAVFLVVLLVILVALMHFKVCAELKQLWQHTSGFRQRCNHRICVRKVKAIFVKLCYRKTPVEGDEDRLSTNKLLLIPVSPGLMNESNLGV